MLPVSSCNDLGRGQELLPRTRSSLWVLLASLIVSLVLTSASASSGDGLHVHDSAHMFSHMEHLSIKPPKDRELSEAEQEYYYFKMHDFDNNDKLDGLELLKSMLDHDGKLAMSDQGLESAVNDVLKNEDTNEDGYVDYTEFIASQRKSDSQKAT